MQHCWLCEAMFFLLNYCAGVYSVRTPSRRIDLPFSPPLVPRPVPCPCKAAGWPVVCSGWWWSVVGHRVEPAWVWKSVCRCCCSARHARSCFVAVGRGVLTKVVPLGLVLWASQRACTFVIRAVFDLPFFVFVWCLVKGLWTALRDRG